MTWRASAGALLVAVSVPVLHAQSPKKIDTSAKAVVAAAVTYVAAYERDLAFVLADELATQHVMTPSGSEVQQRRTRSEFFLTYLPREGTWIAVRDVHDVDGAPVSEADSIRTIIERAPLSRLASVIADKNSRFNIGNIRRTFNEPTIGLLVVSAIHQRRFKFQRVAVSKSMPPIVTMKFTERDRPTLVSGLHGEPVFTRGELDIDAATGCVERTRIELSLGPVRAALTTAYAPDGKLNLWVPSIMRERYENTDKAFGQTITVDTEYSNYRRFDTSVIIK